MKTVLAATCFVLLVSIAPAQTPPPEPAQPPPAATGGEATPDSAEVKATLDSAAVSPRVVEILTQLERRSDGLKDIRCKITFKETDAMDMTDMTKEGQILFLMAEPNPKFLVHFERSVSDGIVGKQEWYLFDGRWLSEAIERIQQVTKKEVVLPGEKQDFFDIEKSPFPLPFGQKKDKILKNFHVELVKPVSTDPSNTDHLVCKPKAGSHLANKYDQLDFYIDRQVHLPRRVTITGYGGFEIKQADFSDLSMKSINTGLTEKDFQPLDEWKGYTKLVEPALREPQEGKP